MLTHAKPVRQRFGDLGNLAVADVCTVDGPARRSPRCAVDSTGAFFADGYNLLLEEGDANGDGTGNLLVRTTGGTLYWGPQRTHGTDGLSGLTKLGTGWNQYKSLT